MCRGLKQDDIYVIRDRANDILVWTLGAEGILPLPPLRIVDHRQFIQVISNSRVFINSFFFFLYS